MDQQIEIFKTLMNLKDAHTENKPVQNKHVIFSYWSQSDFATIASKEN
jgi:hypothetical protein